ncbi:MAG: M23 family metallopeptidase [Chloroflexota bacterium]
MKRVFPLLLGGAVIAGLVAGYFWFLNPRRTSARTTRVVQFIRSPQTYADWMVRANTRCEGAPFTFPTDGYIGFLWDDSFRPGHRHTGLDIFGGTPPGQTPVYAAYDGYLTRLADWKSTVIIRIPRDPLHPTRQIWTYYTHLADEQGNSLIVPQFPPGTSEVFVEQGTLLGFQGNFSGTPGAPVGVHLHFSIVKDDGEGHFLNELEIGNTYDPSPYFNLRLNANDNPPMPPLCASAAGQAMEQP